MARPCCVPTPTGLRPDSLNLSSDPCGARFLEHAYRESDRRVEVREVKLDLCELDFTELGELGAAAIDLAELRGLQRCLQRIFVALSSRDGFNGFPDASRHRMTKFHQDLADFNGT